MGKVLRLRSATVQLCSATIRLRSATEEKCRFRNKFGMTAKKKVKMRKICVDRKRIFQSYARVVVRRLQKNVIFLNFFLDNRLFRAYSKFRL
jgi:hypothetical protein